MDRVWDDDFDQSEMLQHSISQSEEECVRTHVEEPVSITHFILNDFEDETKLIVYAQYGLAPTEREHDFMITQT